MNFEFGQLPTDQATPLALTLAELVANCIEHGGEDRKEVGISIKSSKSTTGYELTICDDGPGIELPIDPQKGIGIPIVTTLISDELGGTIDFRHNNSSGTKSGTCVEIKIPHI